MASALQGKNALIARLVSTVLCPAFDRGVGIAAGLGGFRKPVPNRRREPVSSGQSTGFQVFGVDFGRGQDRILSGRWPVTQLNLTLSPI